MVAISDHRRPSYVIGLKENQTTPKEMNLLPCTGPLIEAGRNLHTQATRILHAHRYY